MFTYTFLLSILTVLTLNADPESFMTNSDETPVANTQEMDLLRENAEREDFERITKAAEEAAQPGDHDSVVENPPFNYNTPVTDETWIHNTNLNSVDVVAIVGKDIITSSDIIFRARLLTEGKYDNIPEDGQKSVRKAALDALIDEHVILQIAAQNQTVISNAEVLEHMKQSDDSLEHFKKFQALGIPQNHIFDMVRADILWYSIASKEIASLNERQPTLPKKPGNEEVLLEEILVTKIGAPEDFGAHVRNTLAEGVPFKNVASQVSHSPATAQHGSCGWILTQYLPPRLRQAVDNTSKGSITEVIETPHHYCLYRVADRRAQSEQQSWLYTSTQLTLKLSKETEARSHQIRQLNLIPLVCKNKQDLIRMADQIPAASYSVQTKAPLDTYHPADQKVLKNLTENRASSVIVVDDEAHVFFLETKEPSKDSSRAQSYRQIIDFHAVLRQKKAYLRSNVSVEIIRGYWVL